MRISCPSCQVTYTLANDRIKPGGSKVRCSKCGQVFTVHPSFSTAPPLETATAAPDAPRQEEHLKPLPSGALRPLEKKNKIPGKKKYSETASDFPLDEGGAEPTAGKKAVSKTPLLLLLVVVITVALLYFGYPFYRPFLPSSLLAVLPSAEEQTSAPLSSPSPTAGVPAESVPPGQTPSSQVPAQPESKAPADAQTGAQAPSATTDVSRMSLKDVRLYFVTNEKLGQLYVLEGKAFNMFDTPRGQVRLRAGLLNRNGNEVVSQEFLGGNTLSQFQLQSMDKAELEKELASRAGVLANNTRIEPKGSTPFMTVFFSPPGDVVEYRVSVISTQPAE